MVAHARDPVPPPSQFRADIPADLEAVVLRCLAKNPQDRYPNTTSLARALDACADAPNWSPEHAALWWHNIANSSPSDNNNRTFKLPDAITQESPVPTQELESAEVPRFV
jgi:eukaryotic-like serine/threonine-protein kinase